jgi:ATP synthase protein I
MATKLPSLRGSWKYMAVGTDMVAATVVGALVGYWLDKWLGTEPWLLVIWFLLGVLAGFYMVYRKTQLDLNEPPRKPQL